MRIEDTPLVSVVMAAYNSALYISDAITSVINQDYPNLELLIINDGSTDDTETVIRSFGDERIHLFSQENRGVSAARNVGFNVMRGKYFCFLDSDDVLAQGSITKRVEKFELDPSLFFLDGIVKVFDSELKNNLRTYTPTFKGPPLRNLIRLNQRVFFGASWLIRRVHGQTYRMLEGLTHGEDLLFYMQLSRAGGLFDYVDSVVLKYRTHDASAMRNLKGLENSYNTIYHIIKNWPEVSQSDVREFRIRARKSMFLSYLARSEYRNAFRALLT